MRKNNKRYTRVKSCEELINIREDYERVVTPIRNKVNKFLRVVGVGCLVVAIIPNGLGFVFYPLAFSLLGISFIDLKHYYKLVYYKVKFGYYMRILKNKLLLMRCDLK